MFVVYIYMKKRRTRDFWRNFLRLLFENLKIKHSMAHICHTPTFFTQRTFKCVNNTSLCFFFLSTTLHNPNYIKKRKKKLFLKVKYLWEEKNVIKFVILDQMDSDNITFMLFDFSFSFSLLTTCLSFVLSSFVLITDLSQTCHITPHSYIYFIMSHVFYFMINLNTHLSITQILDITNERSPRNVQKKMYAKFIQR